MFFEQFSPDKFFHTLVVAFAINVLLTVILLKYAGTKVKVLFILIVVNAPLALVSGVYIGNFYSHGFDIKWWAHGIAACAPSLLVCIIVSLFFPGKSR
jgi:hypothetical protein